MPEATRYTKNPFAAKALPHTQSGGGRFTIALTIITSTDPALPTPQMCTYSKHSNLNPTSPDLVSAVMLLV